MLYRTNFRLEYPVIDVSAAQEYLSKDDMTKYLKSDSRINDSTKEKISKITWILRDDQYGYIELETTDEMLDLELSNISNWVSGQNSDGMGEGFEQQDFANYQLENGWGYDEDEYDDYNEDWVMASFDWRTNDYKFELVTSE